MNKEHKVAKLLTPTIPRSDYYLDGKDVPKIKSSTAYDLIKELILSGEFSPGSRLVSSDLEARLGFGRGAIRDALMRLDKSGLVQNIPYKGAVVAKLPGYREMTNMYEARILIECQLARESMRHITKNDILELERLVHNMQTFSKNNSFIFCHDREFHITLYRLANMPHLLAIIERLLDHVEVFLNTKYFPQNEVDHFVNQHIQMMSAIKKHDTETLCNVLNENISFGLELIRKEFEHFSKFRHWENEID